MNRKEYSFVWHRRYVTEGYPRNGARLSIRYLTYKSNMHNMAYNIWYCGIFQGNLNGINLSLNFIDENVFDF